MHSPAPFDVNLQTEVPPV